ncbi:hypothetical protein ScPMuIL_012870 [Solemya velum]
MTWAKLFSILLLAFWFYLRTVYTVSREHRQLDKFVRHLMKCRGIPGLSLSVVKDGKPFYTKGYGHGDIQNWTEVTENTMFCTGSITKGFTATLMAMVIGNNSSLTWDTPVRTILGERFHLSDEHRSKYVNIRDLLAHKTGLAGYFGALLTVSHEHVEDIIWRLRFMRPVTKFHSKYIYNNYMYILAGYLLEKLSGRSWERLVTDKIFEPLEMTSSTFAYKVKDWSNFAVPHVSYNGQLTQLDLILYSGMDVAAPAGAICSNSVDMAKWMMFHLSGGLDTKGRRLVPEAEFHEMHTPQMPTPMPLGKKLLKQPIFPISEGRYAYNLGWSSGLYRGHLNLLHTGQVYGYDSLIWLFPDNDVGIYTAVNGPGNNEAKTALRVIHHYISDILLNMTPWLNLSAACSFPEPWLTRHKNRAHDDDPLEGDAVKGRNKYTTPVVRSGRTLENYIGQYGHLAFGNITIKLDLEVDLLHLTVGRFGEAWLYPTDRVDQFDMRFTGPLKYVSEADGWNRSIPLIFRADDTGYITSLYALFIEDSAPPEFKREVQWSSTPPPSLHSNRALERCLNYIMTSSADSQAAYKQFTAHFSFIATYVSLRLARY